MKIVTIKFKNDIFSKNNQAVEQNTKLTSTVNCGLSLIDTDDIRGFFCINIEDIDLLHFVCCVSCLQVC